MTVNRYTKLIKTLKESPTNSMGGVYSLNPPGFRVGKKDRESKFFPDIDGNFTDGIPGNPGDPYYLRPEGYWDGGNQWSEEEVPDASQNYLEGDPTGKSTTDLISEDGTVKTFLPPNSRHFILGPSWSVVMSTIMDMTTTQTLDIFRKIQDNLFCLQELMDSLLRD